MSDPLPEYPSGALAAKRTGTVTLRITVDADGRVGEWRQPFTPDISLWPTVTGGRATFRVGQPLPQPFVDAAGAAVAGWRYEPPVRGPMALYVKFHFTPGATTEVLWHDARTPEPAVPAAARVAMTANGNAGVTDGLLGAPGGSIVGGDLASPPPPPPQMPVRVGGQIRAPRKIKDVKPIYPSIAAAARIQGVVIIEAFIDGTGRVADARVLRSVALLDNAALTAVRQWEFTPTILNGQPTAIIMSVTVNFTLTD